VCVVSFLNVPAISEHDLNPELELANAGIVEKVVLLYGIEKSGGVGSNGLLFVSWQYLAISNHTFVDTYRMAMHLPD
jgi:hypothetical protein